MSTTLADTLARHTAAGELWETLPTGKIRCLACGHRCKISEGRAGVCWVRFNKGGKLQVPKGYVAGLHADPVEKKPFFHALPGSVALSFGMLGCDYHCSYCQNWITSQTLRDPNAVAGLKTVDAGDVVRAAAASGSRSVVSTYNEPLITAEWAVDVFQAAREAGLRTAFVSNGNGTPEVLDYLEPWLDWYKVDLKGFDPKGYRRLGGRLEVVLETIQSLVERGIWVEVVTLVVPGFSDEESQLNGIAEFLASVSVDIPWHVTAFHPDYKMTDRDRTPTQALIRAVEAGRGAGLKFIYAGNLHGRVGNLENTCCPSCETIVIERVGFTVFQNRVVDGCCPDCHSPLPGRWD